MNPGPGEGEKQFMSRCIVHEMDAGHDQASAVVICSSTWSKTLMARRRRPMVYETREAFVTRFCENHPEASIAHALAAFKLGPGGE